MKRVLTVALFLILGVFPWITPLFAQNNPDEPCNYDPLEEKYQHYRDRLLGRNSDHPGFVRMGTGQGESLPVDAFTPNTDCYWDYILNVRSCGVAEEPGPRGSIQFSDASQDLGFYIGVLAAEYEVNRLKERPQEDLIEELWLALEAFDRLDREAEQWYDEPPKLDGFFLRDDVPVDFNQDPNTGEYIYPHPDEEQPGYQCLSSAWSCGANDVDDGTFCSQDQMIYVILGLSLVDKFVPEDVVYNGDTLVVMARHDVHRMVSHLRNNNWTIRAPDGTTPPDQYGGSARTFSYQFAAVADTLTNNRYFAPTYQNNYSESAGATFWFLADEFFGTQQTINKAMILVLASITHTWDADKIAERAFEAEMEVFALMQSVLYQEVLGESIGTDVIEGLILDAPFRGPCDNFRDCDQSLGWSASNRWIHPNQRFGNPDVGRAYFNGLDFMLLYNLYEIYKEQNGLQVEIEPCPPPEPPPARVEGTRVYPNPVEDMLKFEFYEDNYGPIEALLVDGMGRWVKKEVKGVPGGENVHFSWDLSTLNSGVYWLRISRNGKQEVHSIFKL